MSYKGFKHSQESKDLMAAQRKGKNTFKGGNAQEPMPYMLEFAAILLPLGYVMDSHFIKGPRPGYVTYKLDFALVDAKVDIELDGGSHHGDRLLRDAKRDAWLHSLGWHVIRIKVNERRNKTPEELAASYIKRGKNVSLGKRGKGLGPLPQWRRDAQSLRMKGVKQGPLSKEHREKIRQVRLGTTHTEETKQKMQASQHARRMREATPEQQTENKEQTND